MVCLWFLVFLCESQLISRGALAHKNFGPVGLYVVSVSAGEPQPLRPLLQMTDLLVEVSSSIYPKSFQFGNYVAPNSDSSKDSGGFDWVGPNY